MMMKRPPTVVVLTVGAELTAGRIADTNAQWICRELDRIGVPVRLLLTVDDRAEAIRDALLIARERGGLILITGGLGPTDDDLTVSAVAGALGLGLVEDARTAERIRERYARWGREPSAGAMRQARVPAGARVLANPVGTAPGLWIPSGDGDVVLLPGVPVEMKAIARESVLPVLGPPATATRIYRVAGLPEAAVGEKVADLWRGLRAGEKFALQLAAGEVLLCVTVPAAEAERADELERWIGERLRGNLYAAGETSLEEHVVRSLAGRGETLAVAESLTGGLLAARLTRVPGASAVVAGGWVAYSDAAKARWLGVESVERAGAVSAEVAREMASGARRRAGADVAVSTTGWAGPEGGTAADPVGTVFVGLADASGAAAARFAFGGGRESIREHAVVAALDLLRRRAAGDPG